MRENFTITFTIHQFYGKFTVGSAYTEDWIHLNVIGKFTRDDLKSAILHEMHHLARGYIFFTKKKISLADTLFSEGLAVVFEMEQVPGRVPLYAKYTNNFIKRWLPELRKENLWGTDFSHDEWFWGKRGKPSQLGYKIGTYLVRQIKKHHRELTAERLVKKNAEYLLKLSKVNL